MAEWLKAPLSKSGIEETLSEVRILPLPPMIILGIETSCDETAVSVVEAEGDLNSPVFKLLGSALHSQVEMHAEYGGVYPNLAKREHEKNLPLVLEQALKNADKNLSQIEMIAVTVGPGLEPALWVGITFAQKLGEKLGIKVIPTNHMEGHIASVLFNKTEEFSISNFQFSNQNIKFPAISLLISGGHTELINMESWDKKEKVGETKDDAVGEAFDKVARMLGLPYPGGPEISRLAEEARKEGLELGHKFPRPMIHSKDLNFSFSGLKTAVLYYLKKLNSEITPDLKLAVAREFEDSVIETLLTKTKKSIEIYNPKTLIIGGGVISNKSLRESFLNLENEYAGLKILIPEKTLTTDNATMIAAAGFIEHLRNREVKPLKADGNLKID